MSNQPDVLRRIGAYYGGKLREHGATPRGVDWNSVGAQETRFDQILRVCPDMGHYTLLDWGCGYGALAPYAKARNPQIDYSGFDVSAEMIAAARETIGESDNVRFFDSLPVPQADFTVASGIFSVKMDIGTEDWEAYIAKTIFELAQHSRRGFAFNMLTSFSEPERMRSDLYYADPYRWFEHCRTRYARNIALLHDYNLYEFTIVVRLGEPAA